MNLRTIEVSQVLELLRRAYHGIANLMLLAQPKSVMHGRLERAAEHLSRSVGELSAVRSNLEEREDDDTDS